MTRNRLDQESSPYLRQHKDNPVHWQPWDDAALATARRENKPILLSIGYSACHWCHVMAHECFEDPEIAGRMNAGFVNIKVDREERPDLDAIYQLALALTGQQGGWPLTMFLTPAGEPFWGGTYFPPTPRLGRPSLPQVLDAVRETFLNAPEKVLRNTDVLKRALARQSATRPGDCLGAGAVERAARRLLVEIDSHDGGFGGAPKFPMTNALELLWRGWKLTGEEPMREAVAFSVARMCQGGIYDHLGGGFARYATDARWLVPHFEKMLYDNALLIELLTRLWLDRRDPLFARRIDETVGWCLREMRTPEGAFASAFDADSEGEEGRYYVWSEAEIDDALGAEAESFKRAYDVSGAGNWEGRNILNRLAAPGLADDATEARLDAARARLLAARAGRERPGWDDSVLADWNGLMIAALAQAAAAFARADWLEAAERAFAQIRDGLGVERRLCHSARAGVVKRVEFLDDYANMARAALILGEVTGNPEYLAAARAWADILDAHYWDTAAAGYFYTPDDGEALIARTKSAREAATPPGNAVMVEVLARLHHLTGESARGERARELVAAFSGEALEMPAAYASLIVNSGFLDRAVQIVIVGGRAESGRDALLRVAFEVDEPYRILQRRAPDEALPAGHPAAGKGPLEGRASAYVCVGPVCSLPITEPEALRDALSRAHASAT